MDVENVIIIGGGPAGYTAALYAARAELSPLLFEGMEPGGQLMTTTEVENFPGFPDGIMGPELMQKCRAQAQRFGTRFVSAAVTRVDLSSSPFLVEAGGKEYRARTVIIATGASAKWLGVAGEETYKAKGVSACATCDGFFFKGKDVLVVGGGDSAMEEANFLTKFATSVRVLVRGDKLRASKIMQERAEKNPKISFLWNTETREILGDGVRMTGAKVFNNKTGETSELAADGLFAAVGHKPNTDLFAGQLDMNDVGYLITAPDSTATKVPGVFAAGDVADWKYRQAVTAAGTGCMAALEAERFLAHQE